MSARDISFDTGSDGASYALVVSGGRLDGARMSISPERWLRIGSSVDSDVVLRDASVSKTHARIRLAAGDPDALMLEVEGIDAEVRVGDCDLGVGQSQRCPLAPVRLGQLELRIEPGAIGIDVGTDESAGSDGQLPLDQNADESLLLDTEAFESSVSSDDSAVDWVPRSDAAPFETGTLNSAKRGTASRQVRLAAVAIAGVLLASVAFASLVNRDQDANLVSVEASLADTLSAAFPQLTVTETDERVSITGPVADREDAMLLNEILSSAAVAVDNETLVVAVLVEQVSDVFRVHGVEAESASAGGTDIEVRTRTADLQTLTAVRETIARDLPDVGKLIISNQLPPTPAISQPISIAAPVEVEGKRVAMVVSDPPGYVVTEDKSRYFIGALLPSGHRIAAIENGRVSLVKDGQTTALDF